MDTSRCKAKFHELELRRVRPAQLIGLSVPFALPRAEPPRDLTGSFADAATFLCIFCASSEGGSGFSSRSRFPLPGWPISSLARSATLLSRLTIQKRSSSAARAPSATSSAAESANASNTCHAHAKVSRPTAFALPHVSARIKADSSRSRITSGCRGGCGREARSPACCRRGYDAVARPVRPFNRADECRSHCPSNADLAAFSYRSCPTCSKCPLPTCGKPTTKKSGCDKMFCTPCRTSLRKTRERLFAD